MTWRFVLKAAVSIILLWLPLRHVALGALLHEVTATRPAALIGCLFALCTGTFIASVRWMIILRALGMGLPLRLTYPMTLIGLFFSQALPAGIGGDIARIWLGVRAGLTTRIAISSIIGDRLAGLLTILLIVSIQTGRIHAVFPNRAFLYSLLAALAVGYIVLLLALYLDKVPQRLRGVRAVDEIARQSSNVRVVLLSKYGAIILACSIAIQCCNILAAFALTNGLQLPISLPAVVLVVPLATVLQTLPISIAGWGVRESFFVLAFGMVGIGAPQALAVSVLLGALTLLSSTPGCVVWLVQRQQVRGIGNSLT